MAKFQKIYINPKTGKIKSKHSGRYETTNFDTWKKRAESSIKDGDKMTIVADTTQGRKCKVTKVITDYKDGTRSILEFGKRGSVPKKSPTAIPKPTKSTKSANKTRSKAKKR